MKIAERMAVWRRERRVLLRVSRAAWRLDQAERERTWALASARAEGVSIRALAAAAGLSSSRVHQIVAAAGLDELDAAVEEQRSEKYRHTLIAVVSIGVRAGQPSRTDAWLSSHLVSHT